jgi:hypothetical protein
MYKLHKLKEEGFIVTSDEQPFPNEKVLSTVTNIVTTFTDPRHFSEGTYFKVIAQQDQIDFSALSEGDQKKIGWIDVEKLANEHFDLSIEDWCNGFQKAQELLSDRVFTLEDIKQSFWRCFENRGLGYIVTMGDLEVELNKSLSQPKSWAVEIEMEDIGEEGWSGDDYTGEPVWNEKLVPKLTDGKIKILKIL